MTDFYRIVPTTIADGDVESTSVVSTMVALWNSGTAYVVGDRVRLDSPTNKVYESILGGTNQNPTTATTYWVEVGATNAWKPFDSRINDLATTTSTAWMFYRVTVQSQLRALAMLAITGDTARVRVRDATATRVNRCTYSEELDQHTKARVTITSDTTVAPDDTITGDTIDEDGTLGVHTLTFSNRAYVAASTYTISAYIKQATGTRNIRLTFPSSAFTGGQMAVFDPDDGSVVTSTGVTTSATDEGDGWWRVKATAICDVTQASASSAVVELNSGTTQSYTGDGASRVAVWGVQNNNDALAAYQWIRDAATYGDTISDTSVDLSSILGPSNYASEAVFPGLLGEIGDYVEIMLFGDQVTMGEIAMGGDTALGTLQSSDVGIITYSTNERDIFGNPVIVSRAFSQRASYNFMLANADARRVLRELANTRDVPSVFFYNGNIPDYGTTVFGYWTEFNIPLTSDGYAFATMEVEGLT